MKDPIPMRLTMNRTLLLTLAALSLFEMPALAADPEETAAGSKIEITDEATEETTGGLPVSRPYAKTEEAVKNLTEMQKYVTQHDGTEKPFDNAYWDNHADGIYVDVVSGEPLFSSTDKYDSGTGWPSFTKPIESHMIREKTDTKMALPRTEVRSNSGDSHLGHVFTDGPKDKGGMRYCINSAAMRFVPKDQLQTQGYGKYLELFEEKK